MNRLIKFRAWNDKSMKYNIAVASGRAFAIHSDRPVERTFQAIMQFTGLLDVKGKEIYEGDIVRFRSIELDEWETGKIVFGKLNYPAFEIEPNPDLECNALQYYTEDGEIEVIGNIYANPELLK